MQEFSKTVLVPVDKVIGEDGKEKVIEVIGYDGYEKYQYEKMKKELKRQRKAFLMKILCNSIKKHLHRKGC